MAQARGDRPPASSGAEPVAAGGPDDDGLTLSAVAEQAGVSPGTVRRWVRDGLIPLSDPARIQTASVGVGEQAERGQFEAGGFGGLQVELDHIPLHRRDQHFQLGSSSRFFSGFAGTVLRRCRRVVAGGRSYNLAAHFEINDRVFHAERQIPPQLKVNH